jgi:hypothetical protein
VSYELRSRDVMSHLRYGDWRVWSINGMLNVTENPKILLQYSLSATVTKGTTSASLR